MKKRYICIALCLSLLIALASVFCLPASAADLSDKQGYSTITNPDIKYAYEQLAENVTDPNRLAATFPFSIDTLDKEELKTAMVLFVTDHPECFWVRTSFKYSTAGDKVKSITPDYSLSDRLSTAIASLDAAVDEIMQGCPDGSDYEKALYLHDALAARVVYEEVGEHQTAYGALVSGKAVCAGYAAAYQLLLRKAGIKAWTVNGYSAKPGSTQNIPHAWNVAWLDGECVYIDVTWDDTGDDCYHYYFALSRSELEKDHITSDSFKLPTCDHTDRSYYDVNSHLVVTDASTAADAAELFGPTINGTRGAEFYFDGNDFDGWLEENQSDIYDLLDGGDGKYRYAYGMVGKEVKLTFSGSFPENAYKVQVNAGDRCIAYGAALQYVPMGEAMEELTVKVFGDYYFPEDTVFTAQKGLTVSRINGKTLVISGTPTSGVTLTLPVPTDIPRAKTPSVTFEATGVGTGVLKGMEAGMTYGLGNASPIYVDADGDITLSGIDYEVIYVVRKGDGDSLGDSVAQIISIPQEYRLPKDSNNSDSQNAQNGGNAPSDNGSNSSVSPFGCNMALASPTLILSLLCIPLMLKRRRS